MYYGGFVFVLVRKRMPAERVKRYVGWEEKERTKATWMLSYSLDINVEKREKEPTGPVKGRGCYYYGVPGLDGLDSEPG